MIRLLNFTTLDTQQLNRILSWRNDPHIRQWMLNNEEISSEDHFRFVESLKLRSDKRYFLVQHNSEDIGVIDFTSITEQSAEFGLYANPELHGVGNTLMHTIIDYAFGTLKVKILIATVFDDNIRAKHLYKKFDFTETNRAVDGTRGMITMELKQ